MDKEIIRAVAIDIKETCDDFEFCTDGCPYYDEDGDECVFRHSPNNWLTDIL